MESIKDMSFGGLLFAIIISGLIWFAYLFFVRRFLKNLVKKRGAEGFDYTFIMVERILLLVTILVNLGLFIMINPLVNSILSIFGVALFFRTLSNFAQGIGFISELRLTAGKSIEVGDIHGTISKLGWTGLFVNARQQLAFVSYGKLRDTQVNYARTEVPLIAYLRCTLNEKDQNIQHDLDKIESIIFQFPLKINQHPVSVFEKGKYIMAEVAVKNRMHLDSLIHQLNLNGFKVKIK